MRSRNRKTVKGLQLKPLADLEQEREENAAELDVSNLMPPEWYIEKQIEFWSAR